MTNQPLFSILIAQYNNGKYLQDALDSVFAQTYTNWEIIIVDDCSTDGISETLYAKYDADPRIHIYRNEQNQGCGYTKHRCVELAQGELCGFLDPDDALTPNALDEMYKAYIKNLDASLFYSTHYICDANLNVLYMNNINRVIPTDTDYLHYNGAAVSHFVVFLRKRYKQTVGINVKYKRAVDQDLYYKLEETGSLIFVPQVLYYYRCHENSISLNENEYKALYWHIISIHDACMRRGISKETENIVSNMLNNIYMSSDAYKEQQERLRHPQLRDVLKIFYQWVKNYV